MAEKGVCPNCYKGGSDAWNACANDACRMKHYHLIPEPWFEQAQANTKKRALMLGQVLDKRYLLVQKIGAGGMGNVFLGLQKPFDRKVAVKVINGVDVTEQLKARFEREARALSRLDHPNIVKLLDYGIQYVSIFETEVPFMVLEYVEGGVELGRFFKQVKDSGKRVSRKSLFHIFSQVLDALGTAHAQGLIHRDIKPGNIMLKKVRGNPFFVKVLDFGLAKAVTGSMDSNEDTSLTRGMIVGTPQYMAPEQGQFGKPVDNRADLYALGTILFEVLCGVRPFTGDSAMDLLLKKTDPQYDPFAVPQAQALPDPMRAFLKKAMALEPDHRFADAGTFKSALESALMRSDIRVQGLEAQAGGTTSKPGQRVYDSSTLAIAEDSDATLAMDSDMQAPSPGRGRRWTRLVSALIVLAGVLIGVTIIGFRNTHAQSPQGPRITAPLPTIRHDPAKVITLSRHDMAVIPVLPVPVAPVKKALAHRTKKRQPIVIKHKIRKALHSKHLRKRKTPKKEHKNGWKFLP